MNQCTSAPVNSSRRRYAVDWCEVGELCGHRHRTIAAAVRCAGTRRGAYVLRAVLLDARGEVIGWVGLTPAEIRAWGRVVPR